MDKDEIVIQFNRSYKSYFKLKERSNRTGILDLVDIEKQTFLRLYARLMLVGMTEDEKEDFSEMVRKVLE